jgi:hypothetical protein
MAKDSGPIVPPLDILRLDDKGELWVEPAVDIETAKARLRVLGVAKPGKYVVFNQQTGSRRFFTVDENGQVSEGV